MPARLPLAWGTRAAHNPAYRVVTMLSFRATSGGLAGLALYALV